MYKLSETPAEKMKYISSIIFEEKLSENGWKFVQIIPGNKLIILFLIKTKQKAIVFSRISIKIQTILSFSFTPFPYSQRKHTSFLL